MFSTGSIGAQSMVRVSSEPQAASNSIDNQILNDEVIDNDETGEASKEAVAILLKVNEELFQKIKNKDQALQEARAQRDEEKNKNTELERQLMEAKHELERKDEALVKSLEIKDRLQERLREITDWAPSRKTDSRERKAMLEALSSI